MKLTQEGLLVLLTIVLIIAAVTDLRFRKIPNWLTYPTMMVGIAYHTSMNGFSGFLFSLEGLAVGIGVFIVPFLMGGMGAGDAKLMGAVGGLLGPKGVFIAFLFTAIVGGIYAVVLLTLHGHLKETARRYGSLLKTFIFTQKFIYIPPPKREKAPRLCYGLVIASGTLISLAFGINI